MVLLATFGLALLALLPGTLTRHIIAGLIFGAGYSMIYTLLNTAVLGLVAPERRGAAFGTFMFGFDAGIGLGSAGLGLVMQHAGFRWGWALGGVLLLSSLSLAKRTAARV